MSELENNVTRLSCRRARRGFHLMGGAARLNAPALKLARGARETERKAVERHIESCSRCEGDYRLFTLTRAALDLAGSAEPVSPDKEFFAALRARLARGPAWTDRAAAPDESWAAAMMLTARQLIPAMALLLLAIIGMTLLWDGTHPQYDIVARQPSERVLFNGMYDLPEPTPDDVLETLVAVEDKEDGK
jgi:nitrogen fixation-related uncharacterized protein